MKPGGRLVYITCSVFAEENQRQIAAFLPANPAFAPEDHAALFETRFPGKAALARIERDAGLVLSPARSHTDGFFFAAHARRSA